MTSQTAAPQPAPSADPRAFKSFADFYPFYLSEHNNRTCRRLHFVGSTLSLLCLGMLVATGKPQYLLYGCSAATALPGWGTSALRRTSPPASSARSTASWATG